MSRNYQMHHMARDEAAAAEDAAERAEMRAAGLSTVDRDERVVSALSCDGCFQNWHPDSVDSAGDDAWCCPACSTINEL